MGRKVKRARRAVMVRTAAIAAMVSVPAVRVRAAPGGDGGRGGNRDDGRDGAPEGCGGRGGDRGDWAVVTMDEAAATAKTVSRVRPAKVAGLN